MPREGLHSVQRTAPRASASAAGRAKLRAATALALAACLAGGCPRRFDPAAAPELRPGDEQAAAAFARARRRFDAGQLGAADAALKRLIAEHPRDPVAAAAALYRARIALARGRARAAARLLAPLTRGGGPSIAKRARYYAGLAALRLGDHRRARALLRPLRGEIAAARGPALVAALAAAAGALGDRVAQVLLLDELHRTTGRAVERAYARARLVPAIERLSPRSLRRAGERVAEDGLAAALIARRHVAAALARGDLARAGALARASAALRRRHGVDVDGTASRPRLGLLVPLAGPFAAVGRLALAGAAVGSGALRADGALTLEVRDSSSHAARQAAALIERDGVVALVGTFAPAARRAVARVAARHRVPFIALARGAAGDGAFNMLPDNRRRVRALARHGTRVKRSSPRAVILRPETPFGQAMARTFARALRAGGGRVVQRIRYRPGTTTFTRQAAQVARRAPDLLFVADDAARLALIAPALAAARVWSTPGGGATARGHGVLLLATADGAGPPLLRSAGRYLRGAVLAPGFVADEKAPRTGVIARRYRSLRGAAPGLVEALVHDAAAAVRTHLAAGAKTRAALRSALRRRAVAGLTGAVRFAADGRRRARPLLYVVGGGRIALLSPAGAR